MGRGAGLTYKIDWQYGCYTGHFEYTFDDFAERHSDETDHEVYIGQTYWMFEGNFGCDCNRVDSRLKEGGQFPWEFPNIHNWDLDDGDWGCGHDVIFNHVEFWRDGRLIGVGRDSDRSYDSIFTDRDTGGCNWVG